MDGLPAADPVVPRAFDRAAAFSPELQNKMKASVDRLSGNTGLNLNIMLNYGGRAEIVDAVNEIVESRQKSGEPRITEEDLEQHLYTKGMPDPDLLIRTASEMRISNFLLWQIAYAEIFVTDVLWPDFRKDELNRAIAAYSKRERRFGKTSEQI